MSYMWGEELESVSVMQHFHANSISETTDLEGYLENPNFLAKKKNYVSSTVSAQQYFHANKIGKITDLEGYLENINFQTKI